VVEVPRLWSREGDNPLDPISLPEPRPLSNYPLAPCKHECSLIKQARHVRQALEVFKTMNPVKQAMMRASACQCGTDFARCSTATESHVARMDCPGSMAHAEMSEGVLYTSSMLHRFGLPYDYAKLDDFVLPESCPCCSAPLRDPSQHPSRPDRIFTWQCHAGRCGGDGRRLQAHEVFKMAVKRMVLTSSSPGGCVFLAVSVFIEPRHLRQDGSRPGDVYAIGNRMLGKDLVMNIIIA